MKYTQDIINCIKDCILALFWSKKDLLEFFKNTGVTQKDLASLKDINSLSRRDIVNKILNNLLMKPDGGYAQLTVIIDVLSTWSYFDPYYFNELKKLNQNKAEQLIGQLKRLKKNWDFRVKKKQDEILSKNKPSKILNHSIDDLKKKYVDLSQNIGANRTKITSQRRGYELEKFIQELAKSSNLEVTEPFKINNGEQIDGTIKYDGEHYLLELKWQDKYSSINSLYTFAHKISGKMYGRGIFISINGFSPESVQMLERTDSKTILVDGNDIMLVLEKMITFSELLEIKIKAAQTKGQIFVDINSNNKYK